MRRVPDAAPVDPTYPIVAKTHGVPAARSGGLGLAPPDTSFEKWSGHGPTPKMR